MKSITVHGGLDYHQDSIQVCVLGDNGHPLTNQRCRNDLVEVIETLRAYGDFDSIAIESCCGAAEFADGLHAATGWNVQLAHPGYVNRMKLNPDKTDHGDARLLADLGRVGYLPQVWLPPRAIRELRTLVRRRQTSVDRRKATKLRIASLLRTRRVKAPQGVGARWTKSWMAWLRTCDLSENDRWTIESELLDLAHDTAQIKRAERRLQEATLDDPMVAHLQTLPEIGPITAWTIRAEVANVDRFQNGKQLARFCGTSPRNCSSGERVADAGLIKAGNPLLKTVLIQAAHRLIRNSSRWSTFATRLQEAGKSKNVVVAAVANRWVRWLFHRMREFQPTT